MIKAQGKPRYIRLHVLYCYRSLVCSDLVSNGIRYIVECLGYRAACTTEYRAKNED